MILGRVYTPPALALRVVRRALAPLGDTRPLRVLDPACGDGAFLRAARPYCENLFGVDIDPDAVETARQEFPGVVRADALVREWRERYDVVVGNPPWVSFSGRHAKNARHYGRYLGRGWPSLHGLFVELGIRIADRVGYLLPAQVCDLDGYGPLRTLLRAHGSVEAELLGEDCFPGVTQPACAIYWTRGAPTPGGAAPLLAREPAPHARPPPGTFGDIGIHTGNCAKKLIRPGGAPVREGKDVFAFRLGAPRKTVHPDVPKKEGEYYRVGHLERYQAVPILLRQTAERPIAALHTEPGYFRNSVLACFGIEGVPHEWVVAWLNSTVVAGYHRGHVREANQRAFPQLKCRHLRDLPMPDWHHPPAGLPELAGRVAHGALAEAPGLDALVAAWFR